jgi:hypothetical protein
MKPPREVCIRIPEIAEATSIEDLEKECPTMDKKKEAAEWAKKAIENANKYHIPLQKKKSKKNKCFLRE